MNILRFLYLPLLFKAARAQEITANISTPSSSPLKNPHSFSAKHLVYLEPTGSFNLPQAPINFTTSTITELAQSEYRYDDGSTALFYMIMANQTKRAIDTIKRKSNAYLNSRHHEHGYNSLMLSVFYGNIAIAKALIDSGANIDAITTNGRTALYSAIWNKQVEIAKLLLNQGANLQSTNNDTLHQSIINGTDEITRILLTKETIDINARNQFDQTPLLLASFFQNEPIVEALLSMNANTNTSSASGETAVYFAAVKSNSILTQLIQAGANVNGVKSSDGVSPLIAAAYEGQQDNLLLLIKAGAHLNHQDFSGNTALIAAARQKHSSAATILIEKGADISLMNNERKTALDYIHLFDDIADMTRLNTLIAYHYSIKKLGHSLRKQSTNDPELKFNLELIAFSCASFAGLLGYALSSRYAISTAGTTQRHRRPPTRRQQRIDNPHFDTAGHHQLTPRQRRQSLNPLSFQNSPLNRPPALHKHHQWISDLRDLMDHCGIKMMYQKATGPLYLYKADKLKPHSGYIYSEATGRIERDQFPCPVFTIVQKDTPYFIANRHVLDPFTNNHDSEFTAIDTPLRHLVKPANPGYCQTVDLDDDLNILKHNSTIALRKLLGQTLLANNMPLQAIREHLSEQLPLNRTPAAVE